MTTMHQVHEFINDITPAAEVAARCDGVMLSRMGSLAREHGAVRWKRSPAHTGRNAHLVELNLKARGLAIYSHHGNLAAGVNGTIMSTSTLRHIDADDFVILLDDRFETARQLKAGSLSPSHPYDTTALGRYRGDEIRAANFNDASQVTFGILGPAYFGRVR